MKQNDHTLTGPDENLIAGISTAYIIWALVCSERKPLMVNGVGYLSGICFPA